MGDEGDTGQHVEASDWKVKKGAAVRVEKDNGWRGGLL